MPKNVNFSDPSSEVGRGRNNIQFSKDLWIENFLFSHTFFQGLPGTKNFYLETDSGVQVGVWQILPLTLVEDSEGKELDWWDTQLNDGRCIYLA